MPGSNFNMKSEAQQRSNRERDEAIEPYRELYKYSLLGSTLVVLLEKFLEQADEWDSRTRLWRVATLAYFGCLLTAFALLMVPSFFLLILNMLLYGEDSLVLSRAVLINKKPGEFLLTLTHLLYSPSAAEKTFLPIIADWRTEYFEALEQGRLIKARFVSAHYIYGFIAAMVSSIAYSCLKILTSAGR